MGVEVEHRPLRVANIIEEGRWGGPQKRITLVAASIKDHAVETTVLLPEHDSFHFRHALDNAGVAWKAMPLHRLGRGWRTILLYALTFVFDIYRLWRELRNGHYDLLHVSGGAWQFKGPIAGRLAGVDVIWHLNDTHMPTTLVLLFNMLSPLASAFIVTANRVRNYYLSDDKFKNKLVFSVQAPVDTRKYSREHVTANNVIGNTQGISILSVANINPVKGLETLILSVSLLKKNIHGVHLFIAGNLHNTQEKYFSSLNSLSESLNIRSHITFLGAQEDIRGVLASCNVFVCSSTAESGPMSVWEAMSMGCAIVSTDVGDVAQYIKNGENGFIVPVGDSRAMANAICKLAQHDGLRHEFGARAREIACRELDVSITAEKTSKAYSAVFAAHRKI